MWYYAFELSRLIDLFAMMVLYTGTRPSFDMPQDDGARAFPALFLLSLLSTIIRPKPALAPVAPEENEKPIQKVRRIRTVNAYVALVDCLIAKVVSHSSSRPC